MLIALLCAAVAVALLFPKTPAGKLFGRLLIEWPAHKLADLTYARVILSLLGLAAIVAVIAVVKAFEDGRAIFWALPEGLYWLAAVDVAGYIDVIGAVLIVAAAVRFRLVAEAVRSTARHLRLGISRRRRAFQSGGAIHFRRRASRRRPTGAKPEKDEDGNWPAPGFALA